MILNTQIRSYFSCRVAIAEGGPTNIIETHSIETTTPEETLGQCIQWLEAHQPFQSIGIASFGPVDLNQKSKTYVSLTKCAHMRKGCENIKH